MIYLDTITIYLFIYLASLVGTIFFRRFAVKKRIMAELNFRTLHKTPTPKGAGLVFAVVFVSAIFYFYMLGLVNYQIMTVLVGGGTIAIFIGYLDDVYSIKPSTKLFFQVFVVVMAIYFLDGGPLITVYGLHSLHSWIITSFLFVWIINAYNFVDGIDGMAITGVISILLILIFTYLVSNSTQVMLPIFSVMLFSCLGFLFFNWPKASIFMGDTGSLFLGYCFGVFIIYSLMINEISLATWLVVLGYFLVDTTGTTLLRMIKVKKWYGSHRSHAYQNLARVLDSHITVTLGILFYHLFWLLPLAIVTVLMPEFSLLAVVFAFAPVVFLTLKFGPLYSSN